MLNHYSYLHSSNKSIIFAIQNLKALLIMARLHFTTHPNILVMSPCSDSNMITKEYYNFLVGEINRGVIEKAVCEVYYPEFNYTSYHLLTN